MRWKGPLSTRPHVTLIQNLHQFRTDITDDREHLGDVANCCFTSYCEPLIPCLRGLHLIFFPYEVTVRIEEQPIDYFTPKWRWCLCSIGDSGRPAPGAIDGQLSPGLDCACTVPALGLLESNHLFKRIVDYVGCLVARTSCNVVEQKSRASSLLIEVAKLSKASFTVVRSADGAGPGIMAVQAFNGWYALNI